MKNLKLNSLVSMFLIVGMTAFTSCGKDGTDVSDKDEVGKFELTIDGKKETGTEVFNGAVSDLRTISAKNSSIEMGMLFDENKFVAGRVLEGDDAPLTTLVIGTESSIMMSGKVKVVSKSKVELIDCKFGDLITEKVTVTGYISSK